MTSTSGVSWKATRHSRTTLGLMSTRMTVSTDRHSLTLMSYLRGEEEDWGYLHNTILSTTVRPAPVGQQGKSADIPWRLRGLPVADTSCGCSFAGMGRRRALLITEMMPCQGSGRSVHLGPPAQPESTALLVELQLGPQFRRPRGLLAGAAVEGLFDAVDDGQAQALLFRAPRKGLAEHLQIIAGHTLLTVAEGGG